MRGLGRAVFATARSAAGHPKRYRSLRGRDRGRTCGLVAGGSAHICDIRTAECVTVRDRHGGFDRPDPTQSH